MTLDGILLQNANYLIILLIICYFHSQTLESKNVVQDKIYAEFDS